MSARSLALIDEIEDVEIEGVEIVDEVAEVEVDEIDEVGGDVPPPAIHVRPPLIRHTEVPPRRAHGSIRRRGSRQWLRLAGLLLKAAAILAVPAGLLYWLVLSSHFQIHRLVAEGSERVPQRWVEETLQPFRGQNLLLLPLAEIHQRLQEHPWVAAAAISKELPDQLRVRVIEKQPAAVLEVAAGTFLVDASGERIDVLRPGAEATPGLVRIRGRDLAPQDVRRALALAGDWQQVHEPWRGELTTIEVLAANDFRLSSPQLPFPLLVGPDSLKTKAHYLTTLLPAIRQRYPELAAVDLRFARRIVLQPSAEPSPPVQPDDGTAAPSGRLTIRG